MEAIDKNQLAERTRHRNASVWVAMDWGGLLSPLAAQQTAMDTLSRAAIENFMAVSDETWGIKSAQRDRTAELGQAEVDQDRLIAEAKVATGRTKLAIQMVTDEYVLAARVYDAKVKALVMGAKEYAALVEQAQLAVDESRAGLAVDKEALHLKEVQAKIYYEAIQRAQVEADLAKAQVEVAKAHVRALMADIQAGQAEIEVIDAEIQKYMAIAEKATLQADAASIYAEAMTKQLSEVKLDVGREEITAGFRYIRTQFLDAMHLLDEKRFIESIRVETEKGVQTEMELGLAADKASEDLRIREMVNSRSVLGHEQAVTGSVLSAEAALRSGLVNAKKAVGQARVQATSEKEGASTWASWAVSRAHQAVNTRSYRQEHRKVQSTEKISGG